jgi:hypothetical protein
MPVNRRRRAAERTVSERLNALELRDACMQGHATQFARSTAKRRRIHRVFGERDNCYTRLDAVGNVDPRLVQGPPRSRCQDLRAETRVRRAQDARNHEPRVLLSPGERDPSSSCTCSTRGRLRSKRRDVHSARTEMIVRRQTRRSPRDRAQPVHRCRRRRRQPTSCCWTSSPPLAAMKIRHNRSWAA